MNLKRSLAVGGLASIVAISTGCDTPGGNYANQAAYNAWAGQLSNQGDYQRANAAANVGTFFGNMGNAEAARKAAEAGKSDVIIINGQEYAPVKKKSMADEAVEEQEQWNRRNLKGYVPNSR